VTTQPADTTDTTTTTTDTTTTTQPAPAPAPVGANTTGPGTAAGGPAPVKNMPQQGTYVVQAIPTQYAPAPSGPISGGK
jgi:hypothetical protein